MATSPDGCRGQHGEPWDLATGKVLLTLTRTRAGSGQWLSPRMENGHSPVVTTTACVTGTWTPARNCTASRNTPRRRRPWPSDEMAGVLSRAVTITRAPVGPDHLQGGRVLAGHADMAMSVAYFSMANGSCRGAEGNTDVRLWERTPARSCALFSRSHRTHHGRGLRARCKHVLSGAWDKTNCGCGIDSGKNAPFRGRHVYPERCSLPSPPMASVPWLPAMISTLRLWDVNTGKQLLRYNGHTSNLKQAVFSPNGKFAFFRSRRPRARPPVEPAASARPSRREALFHWKNSCRMLPKVIDQQTDLGTVSGR